MVREEEYTAPFDLDEQASSPATRPGGDEAPAALADHVPEPDDLMDEDLVAARQAWDEQPTAALAAPSEAAHTVAAAGDAQQAAAAEANQAEILDAPFVVQWNRLISSTNWEKGHIITQWRGSLIQAGASSTEYSDEAWSRRVGGVTASHVGRLRRVYEAFASSYESYPGLYWTHFLAALDWDDAPLWLEGAAQSGWSVAGMRQQRWQANGGDETTRPQASDLVTTDLDEDFEPQGETSTQPAQGGGAGKNYEDGPNAIGSGPAVEGPDFGDEESLGAVGGDFETAPLPETNGENAGEDSAPLVQPFAGLPELPSDLADAVELLKLAVLRHKTAGWKEISAEAVARYLQAFGVLIEARGK